MTTVYDVPPEMLIGKTAQTLKEKPEMKQPDWSKFVKTGVHKERTPIQADWWYTRSAAVLRKVYINGPIGVVRLSAAFGGKKNCGVRPNKAKSGSGSITQTVLNQLEKAGYVSKLKNKGRIITPAGRKLLDGMAYQVKQDLAKNEPALSKY